MKLCKVKFRLDEVKCDQFWTDGIDFELNDYFRINFYFSFGYKFIQDLINIFIQDLINT